MSKDITEEILRKAGFVVGFYKYSGSTNYTLQLKDYHLTIDNITKSDTRNWTVEIENNNNDCIACAEIKTIEHFNKLMDLMDIDFKLKDE